MSKKPGEYSVGYGKPPKATQFKKNQSGNPGGSSIKARSKATNPYDTTLATLWKEEGDREFPMTVNGKTEMVTLIRGVIRRTYFDAMAGKPTALRLAHLNGRRSETDRREMYREQVRDAAEVQAMAQRELDARLVAGEKNPVVTPHPDDIVFNPQTGEVDIVGPTTREEHHLMLARIEHRDRFLEFASEAPNKKAKNAHLAQAAMLNDLIPPRLRIELPEN